MLRSLSAGSREAGGYGRRWYRPAIDDVAAAARAEVIALHEFFVAWFNGSVGDTDAAFARLGDALHVSFSMVVPSGELLDRSTALTRVRGAHGSAAAESPLRIEIRNVVARVVTEEAALVTYEEWQFAGSKELTSRISTAYLELDSDAPNGVTWRHLQETQFSRD